MAETVYDHGVGFYVDFVDRMLSDEQSLWPMLMRQFGDLLGATLKGARVCDLACGEGYLSRYLAGLGAREVVGVDLSEALIGVARSRVEADRLTYLVDDVQALGTIGDGSFDIAVSQLAIMDIPDHRAMFRAVRRILRTNGRFMFSLLHPCFESPFALPDEPQFLIDAAGEPVACTVRRYASEGYWSSGGNGVRGKMGAYHRTLSTLVNDLLASGFGLEGLHEPVVAGGGLAAQVPRVLMVEARAG